LNTKPLVEIKILIQRAKIAIPIGRDSLTMYLFLKALSVEVDPEVDLVLEEAEVAIAITDTLEL
jgi:hypothetical protein